MWTKTTIEEVRWGEGTWGEGTLANKKETINPISSYLSWCAVWWHVGFYAKQDIGLREQSRRKTCQTWTEFTNSPRQNKDGTLLWPTNGLSINSEACCQLIWQCWYTWTTKEQNQPILPIAVIPSIPGIQRKDHVGSALFWVLDSISFENIQLK